MKTYQLATPPKTPGIYLLQHRPTGDRYVGQSRNLNRRWMEWKAVFQTGLGVKSFTFLGLATSTEVYDWEFIVVKELLPSQVSQLTKLERHLISRLQEVKTVRLLNTLTPRQPPKVPEARAPEGKALTVVVGPDGSTITYYAAALMLGVARETVKKRLQDLRKKGVTKVKICGETKAMSPY